MKSAHRIVFANEKGGTGKSTTAVHVAVALASTGHRVAGLDLDTRQRTFARYLDNRAATVKRTNVELAMPTYEALADESEAGLHAAIDRLSETADFVIVDTPGRDDAQARAAITRADTLVTPINDSFVDLDLIGQVDPDTYKIKRPSFYAELIWDLRRARAKADGGTVDWVMLRNRLQHLDAHNMRRVGAALGELSKRVGFRVIPGLGERVIYRELFPKGLTLLDMGAIANVGMSHIAARQELREMIGGLALPDHQALPEAADKPVPGTRRVMIKILLIAALLYLAYRLAVRFMAPAKAMPRADAARLLGVAPDADRSTVIEAHRRLIGRNHPDAGGSADLAARINQARDALLGPIDAKDRS